MLTMYGTLLLNGRHLLPSLLVVLLLRLPTTWMDAGAAAQQ